MKEILALVLSIMGFVYMIGSCPPFYLLVVLFNGTGKLLFLPGFIMWVYLLCKPNELR